jgi:guanine deaminase
MARRGGLVRRVSESTDQELLTQAVSLALENAIQGQLPFGAVVSFERTVLATGVNTALRDQDPTAHAEIAAVRAASRTLGNLQLEGAELFSSCEPCAMCHAAALVAGVSRIVYATPKGSVPDLGVLFPSVVDEMQTAWRRLGSDLIEHVPTPGSDLPFARFLGKDATD